VKQHIQKLVSCFGLQITRSAPRMPPANHLTVYHAALTTLLSAVEKLRVVQVGANDGTVNDPIYNFVKEFPDRTEILLIEPQKAVIPYLKASYEFHSEHTIHNGAVGPNGTLSLYAVAPEFWGRLNVPYANGWPDYRAPTGITSFSREHVHAWLKTVLKDGSCVDDAIMEICVTSASLINILNQANFPHPIDCLQIDAEGFDDMVIYNCDIKLSAPRLIHFEAAHLSPARYDDLNRFLNESGYKVWRYGGDALAVALNSRAVENANA
jgi:FkbM family methyltransferase